MIERLKALSPPLRYAVYAVGALVLCSLAIGVGATAGFMADQQVVGGPTGSAETSTPGGGGTLETTGPAQGLENTSIEPSGSFGNLDRAAYKDLFFYRATDQNSRGDYTYISDPSIDGDAQAIILAAPTQDQVGTGTSDYGHNIGVWYEPVSDKWAIFNQDRAAVPEGTTFEVIVPRASVGFIHYATFANTAGSYTYLDDPLTNGKPEALLSVTQNWNPGGGAGVYNNHPVGTQYDTQLEKWAVYNLDGASMPRGAAFNVAVSMSADDGAR